MLHHALRTLLVTTVLLALAPVAHAAKIYVANNGVDQDNCGGFFSGSPCGSKASPCRSISCAIGIAAAGDTIIVGPGRYGDLNGNGTLGETGEETPSPACGCMLSFNKAVTLVSSQGAGVTVIDARTVTANKNVLLSTNGGDFGKLKKGFTVTSTSSNGAGIVIDSGDVKVRGNQVVGAGSGNGIGIDSLPTAAGVLIEGNQVNGWDDGIFVQSDTTVRKNQVSLNTVGIFATGIDLIVGNVATDNSQGVRLQGGLGRATGNAVYGNDLGLVVQTGGIMDKNNVFGNTSCGLYNFAAVNEPAAHNYWGAATGPGADPADPAGPGSGCDTNGGNTIVTPFATKPFTVRAIKP